MPKPFNFNRWASGIDTRINNIEGWLTQFSGKQKNLEGMAGVEPSGVAVLEQGFVTLEQEQQAVRALLDQVVNDQRIISAVVGGGESATVAEAIKSIETRLSTLAYHVGVYDETVQGVSIRPERAVPATRVNPKTGRTEINPVKIHTKTFSLASTPRTIIIPANGAAKVSFVVPPEQNLEGDFEIYYLMLAGATSSSFRVRLGHTGLGGQFLMNQPVHGLAVFGNMSAGPLPFLLYETIFLEPNQELVVELFDFSGQPNTVELVSHGRRFIGYSTSGMDRRGLISVFARNTWPFWLTTDTPIILATGVDETVPVSMSINRQYHAELAKAMRFGSIGGVPTPVDFHIILNEGQSGNLLFDNVSASTMAGSSIFPIGWPEPYLDLRGTPLRGTFGNDNGLPNQLVDLVFHGRALPMNFPGQRALEPLLDGRTLDLPPASNKDLSIPRMVSQ